MPDLLKPVSSRPVPRWTVSP